MEENMYAQENQEMQKETDKMSEVEPQASPVAEQTIRELINYLIDKTDEKLQTIPIIKFKPKPIEEQLRELPEYLRSHILMTLNDKFEQMQLPGFVKFKNTGECFRPVHLALTEHYPRVPQKAIVMAAPEIGYRREIKSCKFKVTKE